mgnify:CR=1 FL=1
MATPCTERKQNTHTHTHKLGTKDRQIKQPHKERSTLHPHPHTWTWRKKYNEVWCTQEGAPNLLHGVVVVYADHVIVGPRDEPLLAGNEFAGANRVLGHLTGLDYRLVLVVENVHLTRVQGHQHPWLRRVQVHRLDPLCPLAQFALQGGKQATRNTTHGHGNTHAHTHTHIHTQRERQTHTHTHTHAERERQTQIQRQRQKQRWMMETETETETEKEMEKEAQKETEVVTEKGAQNVIETETETEGRRKRQRKKRGMGVSEVRMQERGVGSIYVWRAP